MTKSIWVSKNDCRWIFLAMQVGELGNIDRRALLHLNVVMSWNRHTLSKRIHVLVAVQVNDTRYPVGTAAAGSL